MLCAPPSRCSSLEPGASGSTAEARTDKGSPPGSAGGIGGGSSEGQHTSWAFKSSRGDLDIIILSGVSQTEKDR